MRRYINDIGDEGRVAHVLYVVTRLSGSLIELYL